MEDVEWQEGEGDVRDWFGDDVTTAGRTKGRHSGEGQW